MATYVFHPQKGRVVEAQRKGKSKHKQFWLDKTTGQKFSTDLGAEEYIDQTSGRILPAYEDRFAQNSAAASGSGESGKRTPRTSRKPSGTSEDSQSSSKQENAKKTVIKVNNNMIGEINDDLNLDQAYLLASDYFREISKEQSKVSDGSSQKTIQFEIRTGSKG